MIIVIRSRFNSDMALSIGKWAFALTALFFLGYLSFSFIPSKPRLVSSLSPLAASNLDYHQMLSGPLGLQESKRSPLASALEQKLVLLAQSIRPDLGKGEKVFKIGIKGSEIQRVVKEGEPIFFHLVQHESGGIEELGFSDGPNAKQMIPYVLNDSSLLLKLDGEDEVILQACGEYWPAKLNQYLAKWWGNDLFFREYGGDQYRPLGEKHKIEFKDNGKSYFLFVEPKQLLTFKDSQWRALSSLEEADKGAPLALVRSISSNLLEIEAWDENGFPLFMARVPLEKGQPFRFFPDQVIKEAKLRSKAQVSCKIEKKQMTLKPSDWVIKSQTGWRKLISIQEIDSYLNNELLEELFVIDAIESNGLIRGRQFDAMRMQMRPFTIQAASTKVKSTKKRIIATK